MAGKKTKPLTEKQLKKPAKYVTVPGLKRPQRVTTKGRRWNAGSKRMLQTRLNEKMAMELRLQGLSYPEIGERLKCTGAGVHGMIMRVLDRNDADTKETVPQVRAIELARYDSYLKALGKKIRKGEVNAILAAMKIAERRARLAGLDMPVDIKHVGTGEGGAIEINVFRKMLSDAGAPDVFAE